MDLKHVRNVEMAANAYATETLLEEYEGEESAETIFLRSIIEEAFVAGAMYEKGSK